MRKPNTGGDCDEMSCKIGHGRLDDLPENDLITVNQASCFTLMSALGRRGFDVKLSTPSPRIILKRRNAHEAALARRAAFEKKAQAK